LLRGRIGQLGYKHDITIAYSNTEVMGLGGKLGKHYSITYIKRKINPRIR